MYSNYIAKVLLNRQNTDFKYFSSLNNYRLAKICKPCGYVRDIPQQLFMSGCSLAFCVGRAIAEVASLWRHAVKKKK